MKKFLLLAILCLSFSVSFAQSKNNKSYIEVKIEKLHKEIANAELKIDFEKRSLNTWQEMLKHAESVENPSEDYIDDIKSEILLTQAKIDIQTARIEQAENEIKYIIIKTIR